MPRTPVLSRKVGSATRGTAGRGAQLAESIRSAASGTEPGELMDNEKAKELLRAERLRTERLLSDMDAAVGADLTAANQPGDMYDSAEPLVTEGADDSVRAELQERLAAVGRAEKRLEAGTYGVSVRSGEPIPDDRLEADPTAELTVDEARQSD